MLPTEKRKTTTHTNQEAFSFGQALMLTVMLGGVMMLAGFQNAKNHEESLKHSLHEVIKKELFVHQQKPSTASGETNWTKFLENTSAQLTRIGCTQRQIEVIEGLLSLKTYQEIAQSLRVTERTIRCHAQAAFKRLNCSHKSELISCINKALMEEQQRS